MIILPVNYGRPIKGYSSFEGAIDAAKKDPQQQLAREDGALLAGQSFVGGRAGFSRWALEFTGSLWVEIAARNGDVEWRVTHEPPAVEQVGEPYALRWPTGEESVINPAELFAARVGAPFWQFWVNDVAFYVYLRGKLIMCFRAVPHVDNSGCVLWMFEDD